VDQALQDKRDLRGQRDRRDRLVVRDLADLMDLLVLQEIEAQLVRMAVRETLAQLDPQAPEEHRAA